MMTVELLWWRGRLWEPGSYLVGRRSSGCHLEGVPSLVGKNKNGGFTNQYAGPWPW